MVKNLHILGHIFFTVKLLVELVSKHHILLTTPENFQCLYFVVSSKFLKMNFIIQT